MAECMRERCSAILDDSPDGARSHRPATRPQPHKVAGCRAGQHRSARSKVPFHSIPGRFAERDGALPIPFADHTHELLIVNLTDTQGRQLGNANTGRIQKLENRPISQFKGLRSLNCVEQISNNSLRKRMRERLRSTGTGHLIRRVEEDLPATSLVGEEHPDG
jgi:hypothetical protein